MADEKSALVPYAVVMTGGKQYMVREKDSLQVERLKGEPGQKVELKPVLALSDGKKLEVGKPEIAGAKVACTVIRHLRSKKVFSFKKKRRKGYKRKVGHRQELTLIRIDSIAR